MSAESPILPTLYIWPQVGQAPSLDPSCLASYFYLQLHLRGHFTLSYCGSSDDSPSGQLPCLSYGQQNITGFSAIVKFVDQLENATRFETSLTVVERAQAIARIAQIEAELGELVAYVYFAVTANFYSQTRPALVSSLSVPQRYYVPARLRKSHQTRLEAVGLWTSHEEEAQNARFSAFEKLARRREAQEKKQKAKQAFEKEKILSKARTILEPYSRALASKHFFHGSADQPSTLDVVLAAHVHLLLQALSDASIANLIKDTYPNLASHAESIYVLAFPDPNSLPTQVPQSDVFHAVRSLLPVSSFTSGPSHPKRPGQDEEEAKFARWRWALYGTAFVVTTTYMYAIGVIPIVVRVLAEQLEIEEGGEEGEDEDEDEQPVEDV